MRQIEGKWHRMAELLYDGDITTIDDVVDKEVRSTRRALVGRAEIGKDLVEHMGQIPYFVVSQRLADTVLEHATSFGRALLDLQRAGLLRLPYKEMILQMPDPDVMNATAFVTLRQCQPGEESDCEFGVLKLSLVKGADGREFGAMLPHTAAFNVFENEKAPEKSDDRLALKVSLAPMEPDDEAVGERHNRLVDGIRATVFYALVFGALVWRTKGMEQLKVNAPEKLNKARGKRGKSLVRGYTLLRIGHVYGRDGKAVKVSEGDPRPIHWRCGHFRNQRHGPGLTQSHRVWIDPILVNFAGEGHAPRPKYLMAG
jgi:hypothetical protein